MEVGCCWEVMKLCQPRAAIRVAIRDAYLPSSPGENTVGQVREVVVAKVCAAVDRLGAVILTTKGVGKGTTGTL